MARRLIRLAVIVGITSACLSGTARSQAAPVDTLASQPRRQPGLVSVGDTVRLYSEREGITQGVLTAADSGSLVVLADVPRTSLRLPRTEIVAAEVMRGRRRRGARALGVGAAVGAGVGTALFGIAASDRSSNSDGLNVLVGILLGSVSVVGGTLVGAVASLTHTDRWVRFDPATMWMMPDGG